MVKVVQNRSTELNAQVKLKQTPGKVIKLSSSEGNTQVKLIYCWNTYDKSYENSGTEAVQDPDYQFNLNML